MLSVVVSLALALVLLVSAGMKLASGPAGRAALETYGIRGEPLASVAWAALGAFEAGLAVCVAVGAPGAAWVAAAMFTAFTAAQGLVLVRGRAGAPCACFGARGRIGHASVARVALLAVAAAVLPLLDRRPLSTQEWLAIGLGAALLGVAALAVAVGADGTVLAKGTFNSGAQLESVLAAAERRRGAISA